MKTLQHSRSPRPHGNLFPEPLTLLATQGEVCTPGAGTSAAEEGGCLSGLHQGLQGNTAKGVWAQESDCTGLLDLPLNDLSDPQATLLNPNQM